MCIDLLFNLYETSCKCYLWHGFLHTTYRCVNLCYSSKGQLWKFQDNESHRTYSVIITVVMPDNKI